MTKSPALYVGALSGTSVDGLDLALIAIEGPDIACRAGRTVPLDLELTRLLHGLASGTVDSIDDFGRADHLLGATIAESVLTSCGIWGCRPGRCARSAVTARPSATDPRPIVATRCSSVTRT